MEELHGVGGAGIGAPSVGCSGGEEGQRSPSRERGEASLAVVLRDELSLERQVGDLTGAASSGRSGAKAGRLRQLRVTSTAGAYWRGGQGTDDGPVLLRHCSKVEI